MKITTNLEAFNIQKLEGSTQIENKPTSPAKNFVETFEKAIREVDQQVVHADNKIHDLVTGKDKDLHGTMIAMEKADISTRMLLSIRNKMVTAYQEVMRMQI